MLHFENVSFERETFILLNSVSFKLNRGDMLQVVGENGSGKTTLLRILIGLLPSSSGCIYWKTHGSNKEQTPNILQNVLWIGHQSGMKMALTADENLKFYYPFTHRAARWHALNNVSLAGYEDVPLSSLSAGQQRRVALARLWLSDATFWVLDEPFTALDSRGCALLTERMLNHANRDGLLIFTTHQSVPFPDGRVKLLQLGSH
ncbi:cytochrome c biogenesis heme-transporting ATPase CcmA [Scandinavium manionii]|uniref:cytochrome c biogenesis heme-transporting ATPase CcmA n=1 Tax=Scandinavium manionii TaxID=2926520 RepID=UPI00135B4794|nr:cytochrome c biogenesis heme-transporting ATPase CcmA [Scandinavium manionii]MCS2164229.1 cytochrome c biogenesis heme-transporting ATPase CcmA [Scandinavium manionii]